MDELINRHDDNAGVITVAYQTEMVVHQLGREMSNGTSGSLPDNGAKIPVLGSYKFFGHSQRM